MVNGYDVSVNSSLKWLSDRIAELERKVRDLEAQVGHSAEWAYRLTDAGRNALEQSKK